MEVNELDIQKLITGQALLAAKVESLERVVRDEMNDHETRLRSIESNMGKMNTDISTIRERMTVFNLLQSTFTSAVAVLVYFFKK